MAWKAALLRKFAELISHFQKDVNPFTDFHLFHGYYFKVIVISLSLYSNNFINMYFYSKPVKSKDKEWRYFQFSSLQ